MSDRGDVARPDNLPPDVPAHGSAGPGDPHADPVTDPALRPIDPSGPDKRRDRTVFSALYIGLVLAALVLVFLLIFILQNNGPVQVNFLGLSGTLPTGVALLLAAIAGVLLVAIPGSGRIVQLRRDTRRHQQ